jgi:tetratricopeptide (TPR) repeat protein
MARLALILPFAAITFASLPALAGTPFEASQQFIESGQTTEARRALETELRLRPNNIEARYNLAVLLEEGGHQSDAMTLYEQNLSISWHLASLINLASALERSGKSSESQQWLEKGTKRIKHEATPWYMLAQLSEKRGDAILAAKQFHKALKADPLNGFAYLHNASFQSRNNLSDRGLRHGSKATRLLPECAPCWKSYGSILQHAGKNKEALDAYQHSLSIDPDIRTRKKLIVVLRKLGHLDRAEQMQRGTNNWGKNHKE